MSHLKKRDLAADVYLSVAPSPHITPPLHPVYVYTVYSYSHREGGEGRANQREG